MSKLNGNLTVNYGTGSGTCEKCKDKIDINCLRIGQFRANWVNGRVGEAGGHIKYTHALCFKTTKHPQGGGRASGWLSLLKSKFEGYTQLKPADQLIIQEIMAKGKAEDPNKKAARLAAHTMLCIHKYRPKSLVARLPLPILHSLCRLINNSNENWEEAGQYHIESEKKASKRSKPKQASAKSKQSIAEDPMKPVAKKDKAKGNKERTNDKVKEDELEEDAEESENEAKPVAKKAKTTSKKTFAALSKKSKDASTTKKLIKKARA